MGLIDVVLHRLEPVAVQTLQTPYGHDLSQLGEIVALENGRGLVLEKLDPSSPYHSASMGVDKSAVVRHALHVADTVAFAGDGPPDFEPALLVRPDLRFARGFLAEALRERGETFRPFSCWSEIARKLA